MSDLLNDRVVRIPPIIPTNFPAIAGFWRRFLAFFIDCMILGLVGQLIGLTLSKPLYDLGPYAKPFGLLIILPYFGILNSKIGHGQTLGKKILGLAVRGEDNRPISLWLSLIRITILEIPIFLNGIPLPRISYFDLSIIASIFVYGFGGAITYTMVFNRGTRQGIHDLILSTYVVNLKTEPKDSFPRSARIHWIISGICFCIAIIAIGVSSFISPFRIPGIPYESMAPVIALISDDPNVFTVNMTEKSMYINGENKNRSLIVSIWVKGKYDKEKNIENIQKYADLVLSNYKEMDRYKSMTINITNGYNLGISGFSFSHGMSESIENWRSFINTQ